MSLLVVLRPTIVRSDVQPMWGDRGEMYCKRSFHIDLTSTSPHVQGESKNLISKKWRSFFLLLFTSFVGSYNCCLAGVCAIPRISRHSNNIYLVKLVPSEYTS